MTISIETSSGTTWTTNSIGNADTALLAAEELSRLKDDDYVEVVTPDEQVTVFLHVSTIVSVRDV